MQHDEFNKVFEETVEKSRSVLKSKSDEYSTEDKLHNFKVSAETRGVSNRDALSGMMVKHTTSIYDLLRAEACASLAMWDEKIIDHINYLILLRALVIEELREQQENDPVVKAFGGGLTQKEAWSRALLGEDPRPLSEKFAIKFDFDPPPMPTPMHTPVHELHTRYVCSYCKAERVNTTQSGTIYDRIQCLNCKDHNIISFMKPIIENERSGVDKMYVDPDYDPRKGIELGKQR